MPHRPVRARAAVALLATAALTTTLLAGASTSPATADPTGRGADASKSAAVRPGATAGVRAQAETRAVAAVDQARSVATGEKRGDLTMALREVANTRDSLTGSDRKRADALLARPTAGGGDGTLTYGRVREARPICSRDVCVHYVTRGVNRATKAYARTALRVLTTVHNSYRKAGYREPKADNGRGGNNKIDVYLGQLGNRGFYGYCTSDDPTRSTQFFDRWAYCALDNDYREFRSNTPLQNLQVTVAHEYFHATQYAYDRYEDAWLLEATAAWVEDEMYDGVDDNLQYLRDSPMTKPRVPLDTFARGFHYGTWSFFRFLTEKYPARKGRLPRLVLDLWRRADGARGKPDDYSWQAVDAVLKARRTTARDMLGAYAVANRRPAATYAEGRANSYPTAPLAASRTVSPGSPASVDLRLAHLTTATTRLTPATLSGATRVDLTFDLAPAVTGATALVTVATRAGRVATTKVSLDPLGDGALSVPFDRASIAWVEVTLVNGSNRFTCFVRGDFSCQGRPVDNASRMRFAAEAVS